MKKRIITILSLLFLFVLIFIYVYINNNNNDNDIALKEDNKKEIIKNSYNKYVSVKKDSSLYDENNNVIGTVNSGMYLELDSIPEDYSKELFKLKNEDIYIKYDSISKTEEKQYDERYKIYIPFNKSISINDSIKLYDNNDTYYILNEDINLPIIIDDIDKYYVEFDNKLLYVYKNEVKTIDNINSEEEVANSIPVLNYHFVINIEAGEDKLCEPISICHTDTQFDSHMKYISDNNFYTITMKELEMFIDNKINLPKKSVAITIDDGWFVNRSITILEKYNVMGTLFLIGHLAPPSDYKSNNLEIHSHTWDLHNISNCSEGRSPLLCYDTEKIVEDLKKSRESLNNTPYFCYPFYDYNNHAIDALKQAGFTMALTGGNKKVERGIDKYKVPRYVIYNNTSVSELSNIIN